jgi:hypothetical protein
MCLQLRLDPTEDAAAIPERTLVAGAARRLLAADELDRAERVVLVEIVMHGGIVGDARLRAIGRLADRGAGNCVVFRR